MERMRVRPRQLRVERRMYMSLWISIKPRSNGLKHLRRPSYYVSPEAGF